MIPVLHSYAEDVGTLSVPQHLSQAQTQFSRCVSTPTVSAMRLPTLPHRAEF